MSVSSSVIFELDRQLEEWRTCLPQGLEFLSYSEAQLAEDPQLDQTHRSTDERLRGHLQARYFAAKSIIHRPYIYKTLHHDTTASISDADAAGARTAVGSALMSVVASGILQEPLVLLLHPINSCRRYDTTIAILTHTDQFLVFSPASFSLPLYSVATPANLYYLQVGKLQGKLEKLFQAW